MNQFSKVFAVASIALGTMIPFCAQAGGDSPFPLLGEEENVSLSQVWETADGAQKVKVYQSESGETYVVIEKTEPKTVEVLRRVK